MLASLLALSAVAPPILLHHDDGKSAGPNDYSAVHGSAKELVRFQAPRRMRVSGIRLFTSGPPGTVQLHFWKDIDSSVKPYVPFRHFEFDRVAPLSVRIEQKDIGSWKHIELGQRSFTMEPGERIFVGWFVKAGGPQVCCDRELDSPKSSVVEIFEERKPPKQQVSLMAAAGDFMVRLSGKPESQDSPVRFSRFFQDKGPTNAIAWGDIDGDSFEDLLVNGRILFRNDRGRRFRAGTPISDGKADFGVFADFDNDGDLDLFQGTANREIPDRILKNDGHGRFSVTGLLPREKLHGRSACWLDFDRDGRLDLFVANGAVFGDLESGDPSRFYRNSRSAFDKTFPEAFVTRKPPFVSAVSAGDLNGDGVPELFAGTYRLEPDLLWSFAGQIPVDLASRLGIDRTKSPSGRDGGGHALGSAMADVDNDGDLDLLVLNLMHPDWRGYLGSNESLFFQNQGKLKFKVRRLRELGIDYEETPANAILQDFDNDGRLDLFHHSMYHSANLYVWRGGKWADRTAVSQIGARQATAAATCDFDHDGRMDLAVADKAKGLIVYRNLSPLKRWIRLRLKGTHCNRDAGGAIVRLSLGRERLTRLVSLGRGVACQDGTTLHFGLGNHAERISGEVTWPCGRRQAIGRLSPNRTIQIVEMSKAALH